MSLRIALVAEEAAGRKVLRTLHDGGHRMAAVLAMERGPRESPGTFSLARKLGYETLPAESVTDPGLADELRARKVDLLLNVHSLHIIHPEVLEAPALGSFNLHPGPLPRYAGLNVPSWAIFRGEKEHGVTVHWMDPGIDTGDVAYEKRFRLSPRETGLTLSLHCILEGLELIDRLLDTAARDPDAIPRRSQGMENREYFGPEVPNGGWIDWTWPVETILRFIRAADYRPFPSPWGHPRSQAAEIGIRVLAAEETGEAADQPPGAVRWNGSGDGVRVAAGDGWIHVEKIEVGGERACPREVLEEGAFLAGGPELEATPPRSASSSPSRPRSGG